MTVSKNLDPIQKNRGQTSDDEVTKKIDEIWETHGLHSKEHMHLGDFEKFVLVDDMFRNA